MAAAPIRPDRLLRELDELWVSLGKEQESSDGVLRACAMTLIVCTEESAGDVGETLGMLVRDHPARLIVLRLAAGDDPGLKARVLAQCWMPFGRRQQICCEQIEITMTAAGLEGVPPVIRGLTAPDLPVAIWFRSRTLLTSPEFEPVRKMANKLIVDSAGIADLKGQLDLIRGRCGGDTRVADLAWTRLTPWRESVAAIFDDPQRLARLDGLNKVRICYQGAHRPMATCYLPAWFRHALGRPVGIEFQYAGDSPRARLYRLALEGEGLDLSVTVEQNRRAEIHSGQLASHSVFHSLSDYELLREELMVLGHDPVFEAVLNLAPEFA